MALTHAILHRRANPHTPYKAAEFFCMLQNANLLHKYPTIHMDLRLGFHLGIPPLFHTFAPFNSPSISQPPASDAFQAIVQNELACGRYIGPLRLREVEALIGPFQTSPLSIIPKPHKPSSFRLIQNFSFPYHQTDGHVSVNSYLESDDYPTTWGTFPIFSLMLWHLPPGSQAAVRDVSEAYRTVPLHPSQ